MGMSKVSKTFYHWDIDFLWTRLANIVTYIEITVLMTGGYVILNVKFLIIISVTNPYFIFAYTPEQVEKK